MRQRIGLQNLLEKTHYHRICFDRPWNQSNKDYVYDIDRCYNWDDVLAAINKINELNESVDLNDYSVENKTIVEE